MDKEDKKIIKKAIDFFNKNFSNLEPLQWSDFKPNSPLYPFYIAHVTDNGNISLMFPVSVTPDLAHLVLSPEHKILKTNKALDAELDDKERR
tara:strand:+ start:397 stop:672 length:276 start_codon:yes stop_codon:yes gene_type:complete